MVCRLDYQVRGGFTLPKSTRELAGYYFEVLETVEEPEAVYEGRAGECIAVRAVEEGKYIVVAYRELGILRTAIN